MEIIDENKLAKRKKRTQSVAFFILGLLGYIIISILIVILGFIVFKGFSVISWDFLTKMPEEGMTKGGILRVRSKSWGVTKKKILLD